jgi:hypothetical protein
MAASNKNGLALAAKEHLVSSQPITRLEAIVLYGVSNLPDVVKEMRGQGWMIKSRKISYAAAMNRLNEFAMLQPPKNLPIREIQITEYWVSR